MLVFLGTAYIIHLIRQNGSFRNIKNLKFNEIPSHVKENGTDTKLQDKSHDL